MNKIKSLLIFGCLLTLLSCNKILKEENNIDIVKRDIIVKKYDLLNFHNFDKPILLSIDEFFDGNNDEGSIAPNLIDKPCISEYYDILKKLSENPKVIACYVKLNEVMIYDNGKLNDNEWFYSDMIYIIGDLTKEEVKEATKKLKPDEVEYEVEMINEDTYKKYIDKKIVYIWWD
jgi:hypothetical protein